MSSKFLAAVLIGGLCAAAAGGGAYLAIKQNAQAAPSAASDVAQRTADATPMRPAAAPAAVPAPSATESSDTPHDAAVQPAAGQAAAAASALAPVGAARPQVTKPVVRQQPTATTRRVDPATAARSTSSPSAPGPAGVEPQPAVSNEAPSPAAVPTATAAPSPYVPSRPTLDPVQPEPVATPAARVEEDELEDLQVPADAVIGLQVDRTISSDFARIEDRVDARVTRDVRVGGQIAIPAGSKVRGSVTMVESGGKFKTRARLAVKFHTIFLPDGTQVPIQTEAIYREGGSPSGDARAKIGGGAVGGAIIGAILGGRKGAAIGGTLGAGAGTAAVAASDNDPATLPSGSTVTVRLRSPATVTIEKHHH